MSKSYLALALLLSACGSSSPKSPDAGVDAPPDMSPDVPTRTVTGHYILHLVSPSGDADVPIDLSHATVEVMVPPDFTPIVGTGSADGTFSVPNVPVGEYYFVAGTHYYVTSADTLDLDTWAVGRSTAEFATQPTNVTLDLTGMDPWQAGDQIQMYSPQSGTLAYSMDADATSGAPAASDTSLNGMVYDLRSADRPSLPDATAGDEVTVVQLSTETDGTRTYNALTHTFSPSGLTVTNGGSATINGAFTAPSASQTLAATWNRPAFAAELAAHFPHAEDDNWSTFGVTALQRAGTLGFFDGGPDLVYFAPGYTTDSSVVSASWPYADPYPADWGRILWNRYEKYRYISLPGAQPTAMFADLEAFRDLTTLADDPQFEPLVGLVLHPRINDDDALSTTPLTDIGGSPTLSWNPPSIGTASKYYVVVYRVNDVGGVTEVQETAVLETAETHLKIPPNLLSNGQPVVFSIEVRSTTADLVAHPHAYGLPDAFSSLPTTIATP
jgi:hypothetical protein